MASSKSRRAGADKALRIGDVEDKLVRDVATLGRDAGLNENPGDGSHKTTVCYNAACADYRVERHGSTPCACKRTSVAGAGR